MSQKNTNPKLVVHQGIGWDLAVKVAGRFNAEYPTRTGLRDCVVYAFEGYHPPLLVYRTKGGAIVVRK